VGVVLALLPSPLVGPRVWRPVAERLSRRGWTLVTPPPAARAPRSPDDVLQHFVAAMPSEVDLVLIAHSNAGLYVPALTMQRRVTGYVFVDAGLPASQGRVPLAPPALLGFLTQLADDDGLLPPWSRWWGEADLAPLFPSIAIRRQIEQEQQQLPLSYFRGSLPAPSGWDDRPGAYLAFGDTYSADRTEANRRGWPVTTLSGNHLHMLVDPDRVTATIDSLLAEIGIRPNPS